MGVLLRIAEQRNDINNNTQSMVHTKEAKRKAGEKSVHKTSLANGWQKPYTFSFCTSVSEFVYGFALSKKH